MTRQFDHTVTSVQTRLAAGLDTPGQVLALADHYAQLSAAGRTLPGFTAAQLAALAQALRALVPPETAPTPRQDLRQVEAAEYPTLRAMAERASARLGSPHRLRLRKVGTFSYKGSIGLYVEAVDISRDQARYAAIEYGQMEEAESRALDRGEVVESAILDPDPEGWLHHRLDECHP